METLRHDLDVPPCRLHRRSIALLSESIAGRTRRRNSGLQHRDEPPTYMIPARSAFCPAGVKRVTASVVGFTDAIDHEDPLLIDP
jgi:hypothetical protein